MKNQYRFAWAAAGLLLAGCSSEDGGAAEDPATEVAGAAGGSDDDGNDEGESLEVGEAFGDCQRGAIEPDFTSAPLAGPAVVGGTLPGGQYLFSSTYLQLGQDAESQQLFAMLLNPIVADLQTRPGLLALALGSSAACGTARTLAVWEDEAAMVGFVSGEAHGNAMARVTDVSRGGSIVTHWVGDESSGAWSEAASRIAADDGPFY
jgi:hypothetical protein